MTGVLSDSLRIVVDDLSGPEVAELLQRHLAFAALQSPKESMHALDIDGLRAEAITFWTAWRGVEDRADLVGCIALKELDPGHGEIKSMHTAETARGQGIARKLVEHLMAEAGRRGYRRLSLETGTPEAFAPARALYTSLGFKPCPPFAGYFVDPFSICMTKTF